jgi:hypothetical protein
LKITDIQVRYVAEGMEAVGHLQDVSRSGVNIRASDLPRQGAIVALQFESPTGGLVDVRGEVRWSAAPRSREERPDRFGVRLHEPPREFREFVAWALAQCEKEDDETDEL